MTARHQIPETGQERETLNAFLDFQRATAIFKVSGLSEVAARQSLVPSRTTVAGVINHLTVAERYWFRKHIAGDGWSYPDWDTDEDADWLISDSVTLVDLVEEYERACQESRDISNALSLDALSAIPTESERYVRLRWLIAHMTQETARHNGHLDILRELLDGTTGR
jgi:uncharacterized damage-inducible protein DinB